jgi:hypothetical protein
VVHGAASLVEYSYPVNDATSMVEVRFDPETATGCDAEGVPIDVENGVNDPVTVIVGVEAGV